MVSIKGSLMMGILGQKERAMAAYKDEESGVGEEFWYNGTRWSVFGPLRLIEPYPTCTYEKTGFIHH